MAYSIGKILSIEDLIIGKPGIQSTVKRRRNGQWSAKMAHRTEVTDPISWMASELERAR
jgi:hypothetical protein